MKYIKFFLLFSLVSCGGGGGGSSSGNAANLVNINFSSVFSNQVEVGTNYSFSWNTSSNAVSCSSFGDWGETISTSGSYSIQLDSPRSYTFSIRCLDKDSKSYTNSISVIANYMVISGSVFHTSVEDKEVYIDLNFNRTHDNFEPISDINNGTYEIRTASLNDRECYKNFPVRVKNMYLASPNPNELSDKSNINISPVTSLYAEAAPIYLVQKITDPINNSISCDLSKNNFLATSDSYYRNLHAIMFKMHGYQYHEIQEPPGFNYSSINQERFSDLDKFYTSLESVKASLLNEFKTIFDQQFAETEFSSADINISSTAELDIANAMIFLNDQEYPNSLADSFQAINIDNISLQADMLMNFDFNENLPRGDNLNGWRENFSLYFPHFFINNNSKFVIDSEDCWVNFSSLCLYDVNTDFTDLSNPPLEYMMTTTFYKESARGVESIETLETFLPNGSCSSHNKYKIEDRSSNDIHTSYTFINQYRGMNTDFDGVCNKYSYQNKYTWIYKFFEYGDGSAFFLGIDHGMIDSLPDAYDPLEINEYNLPPGNIPFSHVTALDSFPDLIDATNINFDINNYELIPTLVEDIYTYTFEMADSSGYGWLLLETININGGYIYVVLDIEPSNMVGFSYNFTSYCNVNGENIIDSRDLDSTIDTGDQFGNSYIVIQACLSLNNEDSFLFSRKSSLVEHDSETFTLSPYKGFINNSDNLSVFMNQIYNKSKSLKKSSMHIKSQPRKNIDTKTLKEIQKKEIEYINSIRQR